MTGTARKSAKNRAAADLEKEAAKAARREAIEIKGLRPRWSVALLLVSISTRDAIYSETRVLAINNNVVDGNK